MVVRAFSGLRDFEFGTDSEGDSALFRNLDGPQDAFEIACSRGRVNLAWDGDSASAGSKPSKSRACWLRVHVATVMKPPAGCTDAEPGGKSAWKACEQLASRLGKARCGGGSWRRRSVRTHSLRAEMQSRRGCRRTVPLAGAGGGRAWSWSWNGSDRFPPRKAVTSPRRPLQRYLEGVDWSAQSSWALFAALRPLPPPGTVAEFATLCLG